jgi:hypothetical protein
MKREANKKINNFWTQKLVEEASSKSSLKYLNIKNLEIGKSSNVWNLHLEPRLETGKAIVKARMISLFDDCEMFFPYTGENWTCCNQMKNSFIISFVERTGWVYTVIV